MARMAGVEDLRESAMAGDAVAAFELAMALAGGSGGMAVDLTAAHCWFNVAAARGYGPAAAWRSEIAGEMTARQVAEAQRRARAVLAMGGARAA